MSYWGEVFRRAAATALQDAKLNTASVLTGFVVQGIFGVVLFALTGFTDASLWTRLLTALVPFLAFPVAFAIRIFTEPAAMHLADRARIVGFEKVAEVDPASHQLELVTTLDNEREPGRLQAILILKNVGSVALRTGRTTVTVAIDGVVGEPQLCDAAILRVGSTGSFFFDCGEARVEDRAGSIGVTIDTTFGIASRTPTRSLVRYLNIRYRVVGAMLKYATEVVAEDEHPLPSS